MTKPFTTTVIKFAALHISALNMRADSKASNLDDILPSIRERGILYPLFVRDETPEGETDKRYGIIAGRRRFNCLIALQMEAEAEAENKGEASPTYNPDVNCIIIDADDDAKALEISLIENLARTDASEMEQYNTFYSLIKAGQSEADIAATFGLTIKEVQQRLALGNIIPPIQKLYEQGEIDVPTIRAFTLATKKRQKEWVKLRKINERDAPTGRSLRAWIAGGGDIKTSAALFDVSKFNGKIISDLFGDDAIFANADEFWNAQSAALKDRVSELTKDGWEDIHILDGRFNSWNYAETAKEDGGHIFIEVDKQSGEITFHKGQLTHIENNKRIKAAEKAEREALAAENGESLETEKKAPRAEMATPILEYMALHRHSVVRKGLLEHSDIAARLITAHMLHGSAYFTLKNDPRRGNPLARKSAAESKAEAALTKERDTLAKLLGFKSGRDTLFTDWSDNTSLPKLFLKMMKLSGEEITRLQTFLMTESLSQNSEIVEILGVMMGLDMSGDWQPDEAFFELIKDKRVINAMLSDIAGEQTANAHFAETGKKQKAIVTSYYEGTSGRTAHSDFMPRWASFPAKSYVTKQDCHFAELFKPHKKGLAALKRA